MLPLHPPFHLIVQRTIHPSIGSCSVNWRYDERHHQVLPFKNVLQFIIGALLFFEEIP
jgi:hypothetical protein